MRTHGGPGWVADMRADAVHALIDTFKDDRRRLHLDDAIDMVHCVESNDTGSEAWVSFDLNVAMPVAEKLRRKGWVAKDVGHSRVKVERPNG